MKEQLATWRWAIGGIALSSALAVGLWGLSTSEVRADREHEREHDSDKHRRDSEHYRDEYKDRERSGSLGSPTDALYVEECGSCHLAYPPQLLGARNWQALMSGLDDHFGENAELGALERTQIQDYLNQHAADNSSYQNSRYQDRSGVTGDNLRITQQPFFIREHDEVPERLVTGNEKIGSFSQCDSCHGNAAKGSFDEDEVNIPGYGRWD